MCCSRRRSAPTTSVACFARPDSWSCAGKSRAAKPVRKSLAAAEDAAIAEAVKLQDRVGLRLATDGEFRRRSYHSYFYRQLGDVTPDAIGGAAGAADGGRGAQPQAVADQQQA